MKELTVKDLLTKLADFEPDAIVLICDWSQESKFGYNYSTVTDIVDETESFSKLNKDIRILTKYGEVVPHLKLRGQGRRFVVVV